MAVTETYRQKCSWEFAKKTELMVRFRIQLWELGPETEGASILDLGR